MKNQFRIVPIAVLLFLFLAALLPAVSLDSDQAEREKHLQTALESINERDGSIMLHFLSSDLLEGREISTAGYLAASEYAASLFALWGLQVPEPEKSIKPGTAGNFRSHPYEGYFQSFELREVSPAKTRALIVRQSGTGLISRELQENVDFTMQSDSAWSMEAPVVFAGYGIVEPKIGYDDYRGLDVKGKVVMILEGTPGGDDPASPFRSEELKKKYSQTQSRGHGRGGFNPVDLARSKGALALVIVAEPDSDGRDFRRRLMDRRQLDDREAIIPGKSRVFRLLDRQTGLFESSLPILTLGREQAISMFSLAGKSLEKQREMIDRKFKPASMPLPGIRLRLENEVRSELVRCRNVIAVLPGSDPELKDEYVVVGAHLDHLGKRGEYVFNGADDNASGSVGVLQAARAMAGLPVRPPRSVIFALWTGEEKGLLGSRYFVANSPVPTNKIKAYLNLDMIGTPWTLERLQRMAGIWNMELPEGLTRDGASAAEFLALSHSRHDFVENNLMRANQQVGLKLHLRPSDRAGGGSDHTSFGLADVPWVFFMAGMGEHYHRPGDHPGSIDLKLMTRISRLVFLSAYFLAME